MPSPAIPRSKSVPRISAPQSPSSADVPLSIKSSRSANSPRTWPKKFGDLIAKKSGSSPKNSKLTEESLKEFNRLNEILEKRYLSYSPYYKGLTDASLVINRQKPSTSPDRESHAGSIFSTSSKSSFVIKMQEWGSSCFVSTKDKEGKTSQSSSSKITSQSSFSKSRSSQESCVPTSSASASTSSSSPSRRKATDTKVTRNRIIKIPKDQSSERKELSNNTRTSDVPIALLYKGKPLRERVSEPPSPPPTPPHSKVLISQPPLSRLSEKPEETELASQPPSPLPAPTQPQPVQASLPQQTSAQTTQRSKRPPRTPSQTSPADQGAHETEKNAVEKDKKYIWADKYQPVALKDFLCNRSQALELQDMAKSENCANFIFEGQPGVGKRTMVYALLREVFGPEIVQVREECKKFILKGEAVGSITVKIKQSPQLVEINLSELRGYEKNVIVELIKDKNNKASKALLCNRDNFRAIILHEADKLPNEALLYIRWILERHKGCNNLFFCCTDASKIQPLHSICTVIKLLPPSNEEIIEVLEFIAKQEGIALPHQLAAKIARNSQYNLRQAIRSFEATWQFSSFLKEDQEIMTGWEDDIANIAKNIIEEQSPKQLYNIRGKLQNLIEHNVSPEFIFETLVKELKKNLDEQLRKQIDNLFEKYNRNDNNGKPYAPAPNRNEEEGKRQHDPVRKTVQQFMRIEECIAKFMSWYKSSVVKNPETQAQVIPRE